MIRRVPGALDRLAVMMGGTGIEKRVRKAITPPATTIDTEVSPA